MSIKPLPGYKAKPLGQSMSELDKIWALVGKDAGAMIPMKTSDAVSIAKKAGEDRKVGKCKNPVVHFGTESGNLVFRIEADGGYAKQAIVVKGYDALKKERAKTTVVNAHKGDSTIDQAAKDMAKIKGTSAKDADTVDLNKKGSTAPIVILAHGNNVGKSPGTVYAKDFAKKSASEIVSYIVGKKLAKNYAGVIYLDGCYTAAGPKKGTVPGELTNFCKTVYAGLVKNGYKYLQVKGNLGLAATMADGTEMVLDAQVEAKLEQQKKKLLEERKKLQATAAAIKTKVAKLEEASAKIAAKHGKDAKALAADPALKVVREEVAKLETQRAAAKKAADKLRAESKQIDKDMEPGGKYDIADLVGVFGPEKIATKPWYKKLFA